MAVEEINSQIAHLETLITQYTVTAQEVASAHEAKRKQVDEAFHAVLDQLDYRELGIQFQLDALYEDEVRLYNINIQRTIQVRDDLLKLLTDLKSIDVYESGVNNTKKIQKLSAMYHELAQRCEDIYAAPGSQVPMGWEKKIFTEFEQRNDKYPVLTTLYENYCGTLYTSCLKGDEEAYHVLQRLGEAKPVTWVAKGYLALILHENEIPLYSSIPRQIPRGKALMKEYLNYTASRQSEGEHSGFNGFSKHDHFIRGRCVAIGLVEQKNVSRAIQFYELAAAENYAPAQYSLGIIRCYGDEIGVAASLRRPHNPNKLNDPASSTLINYKESVRWLEAAANQSFPDAQYQLGVMYDTGLGVKTNAAKSRKWFISTHCCNSTYEISGYYKTHFYTGKKMIKTQANDASVEEGVMLLERCASMGYLPSINQLIEYYMNARFFDRVIYMAKQAYELGDIVGESLLAQMGIAVPPRENPVLDDSRPTMSLQITPGNGVTNVVVDNPDGAGEESNDEEEEIGTGGKSKGPKHHKKKKNRRGKKKK